MSNVLDDRGAEDLEAVLAAQSPVRSGVKWNAAGQLLTRAAVLGFGLMLARILDPREFGLFALASGVIALGLVLSNIGVSQALVQRQRDVPANASAAFYLNLIAMAIFALVMVLLAAPMAKFFHEPTVRGLMLALAVAFFVRGTANVHEAFMRKHMRFRALQVVNLASVTVYGIVAIVAALQGAGAWSLALGLLVGNTAFAATIVVLSRMPLSLNPHLEKWRGLFRYGGLLFLAGSVWAAVTQGDNLVVGRILGAAAVGAYALAYNYGAMPAVTLGGAVAEVMFSALARVQDDRERLASLVLKAMRNVATISLPLGAVALFVARDLLVLVLGERWAAAAVPFQVFAVLFTSMMFFAPFSMVYLAVDKPQINLRLAVLTAPILVVALVLGLPHGIVGVALGVACMMLIHNLMQTVAMSRVTGVSVGHILGQVVAAMVSVSIAVAVAGAVFIVMPVTSARPWIAGALVIPVYVGVLRFAFRSAWSEASAEVRALARRRSE